MTDENPDKQFAAKVPPLLKDEIGAYYVQSRSRDPSVKIPSTRSLVSSLQTAMVICGEKKYDDLLEWHKINAINALSLYASDNWAAAQEECDKILDDVAFLVYAGYGSIEAGSYSLPVIKGDGKK
jgi:hypothetical protein